MAELTKLESKLGEVTGLAMAAQVATEKVRGLTEGEDVELATTLEQMHQEAAETERRCVALAGGLEGKKTAILDEAASTKGKAAADDEDVSRQRLRGARRVRVPDDGRGRRGRPLVDPEDAERDRRHSEIAPLVAWALPIQERHFADVKSGSLKLAGEEDPNEPA